MNWYFVFGITLALFQMGYAGILAVRVGEYSFCGHLGIIGHILYWIFFYFTGTLLLLIALPLRLLGFKIYPVFIPDSY
ncbi:hypothetical protein HAP94_16705 [Acidithiobacillus ferrivorans]|nr:hypothetical protein [Acidithiobacillus ferrivorans]